MERRRGRGRRRRRRRSRERDKKRKKTEEKKTEERQRMPPTFHPCSYLSFCPACSQVQVADTGYKKTLRRLSFHKQYLSIPELSLDASSKAGEATVPIGVLPAAQVRTLLETGEWVGVSVVLGFGRCLTFFDMFSIFCSWDWMIVA